MPRNRAACDKAIREAWKKERQLVLEGKGTRDWSEEQQLEIIELGKVFDDDGKAFEGQHMKSVVTYPEHQGNPDNIQLLSHEEHLAAHKGDFHNQTNWYYNPVTLEFLDFGDGGPIACKEIELSNPIWIIKEFDASGELDNSYVKEKDDNNPRASNSDEPFSHADEEVAEDTSIQMSSQEVKGLWAKVWNNVKKTGKKTWKWVKRNPGKTALIGLGAVGAGIVGHEIHKAHKNNSTINQISMHIDEPLTKKPKNNDELMKIPTTSIMKEVDISTQHSNSISDIIGKHTQSFASKNADSLNKCSKLFNMGYSTRKSPEERHKILDSFIDTDGIEKAKRHLQFLVNTRKHMKNGIFEDSVSKWLEDLEYLSGKMR